MNSDSWAAEAYARKLHHTISLIQKYFWYNGIQNLGFSEIVGIFLFSVQDLVITAPVARSCGQHSKIAIIYHYSISIRYCLNSVEMTDSKDNIIQMLGHYSN